MAWHPACPNLGSPRTSPQLGPDSRRLDHAHRPPAARRRDHQRALVAGALVLLHAWPTPLCLALRSALSLRHPCVAILPWPPLRPLMVGREPCGRGALLLPPAYPPVSWRRLPWLLLERRGRCRRQQAARCQPRDEPQSEARSRWPPQPRPGGRI